MAIRLFLVGMVACLALEAPRCVSGMPKSCPVAGASAPAEECPMPNGPDAFATTAPSEAPAPAMIEVVELAEIAAPAPRIEVVDLAPEPAPAADPDAAFRSAMRETAAAFAADLAPPPQAVAEVEMCGAGALDLNLDPATAPGREAEPEAVTVEVADGEPARPARLVEAVRLTARAVDAWAGLLR